MIGHIPRNTRIFIGLLIITLLLTYLAVFLSDYQGHLYLSKDGLMKLPIYKAGQEVDVTDWQSYTDKTYPLTFLFPKDWTVKATSDQSLYTVSLDIPDVNADIRIYISQEGFIGMQGLTEKTYKLKSEEVAVADDNLIAIKAGDIYYTFDGSLNPKQSNEFSAIIRSVKFQ